MLICKSFVRVHHLGKFQNNYSTQKCSHTVLELRLAVIVFFRVHENLTYIPDRWEVGLYFAHHFASSTPLHPSVTLHFEMLLFHAHFMPMWTLEAQIQCKKCAKEVHTSRSADEAERKGNPSVALQVPFLTTLVQPRGALPLKRCMGRLSPIDPLF